MHVQRNFFTLLMRCAFCAALVLVAAVALYPNLTLPEPVYTRGFTDKIYHVVGFVMLVVVAGAAWRVSMKLALCMSLVAVALELCQFFAEGRDVFLADMMANLTGVAGGLLLLRLVKPWIGDREAGS